VDPTCCGIEYCNSSCIVPQFQNNLTSSYLTVDVEFIGQIPTVALEPLLFLNGTFMLSPSVIEEISPTGIVIQSVPFPSSGYDISYSSDPYFNQIVTFTSSFPSLVVSYELSSTFPNPLALSLTISNWNWTNPLNTLLVHMIISLTPPVQFITMINGTGNTTFRISNDDGYMATNIITSSSGLADAVSVPVVVSLFDYGEDNGTSVLGLVFAFPHFISSFIYVDTEISVTAEVMEPPGLGSGPSDLYALLALLGLVFIPLVIIFFGLGAFNLYREKKKLDAEKESQASTVSDDL